MATGDKFNGNVDATVYKTGITVGKDDYRIHFQDGAGNPANLITGNTVNITFNSQVLNIAFNTSNNQTISDIITAMLALTSYVSDATPLVNGLNTNYNGIFITGNSNSTLLDFTTYTVTGGASQATIIVEQVGSDVNEKPAVLTMNYDSSVGGIATFSSSTPTTSGTVTAGAFKVVFTANATYTGNVNGSALAAGQTITVYIAGRKLPAITYTVGAGALRIDVYS